jgi:hypothetical protein
MVSFFRKATPERRFWEWFERNSPRLFAFEKDQDRIFADLTEALYQVQEGLTFEFGPVEDGRREFVVSADGVLERFDAVRRLVAAAPPLPQWVVIPFRPPKSLDFVLDFGGHRLSPGDLWFQAERDGERVGLTLYLPGLTEENRETLSGAGFILLDTALGEFAVESQVGFIEFEALPDEPEALGLRRFPEILAVFHTVAH